MVIIMIDWTKPLKPTFPELHKLELLKILSNGDLPYVVAVTNLNTGLEDVIFLDKYGKNCFNKKLLEPNVEPPKPHKHADIIKAWADGYKIAIWDKGFNEFRSLPCSPLFYESCDYAVLGGQGYDGPAPVAEKVFFHQGKQ